MQPISISHRRRESDYGITIVEVLATISIIGVLIAMLLPAVQSAREVSRRSQCQNYVRSVGQGLLSHHATLGAFPSGGWGHRWVGAPGRGSGKSQPGGWIYSLLPFIGYEALYQLGDGASGADADRLYAERLSSPITILTCPSRRPAQAWPIADTFSYMRTPKPFGVVTNVARADYAMNGGVSHIQIFSGPASLEEGDREETWAHLPLPGGYTGMSQLRFGAAVASIADGTSHTYLVGEKHVFVAHYENGKSLGDNESLYSGYCSDLYRFAGSVERLRVGRPPYVPPLSDQVQSPTDIVDGTAFGSAHQGGLIMVYCDGSVRFVAFDIDPEIHFRSAHRRDRGQPIASLR
jgi:hypothetical protein